MSKQEPSQLGMYRRSFTDESWWNKMATGIPVDPFSEKYKQALKNTEPSNKISIGVGSWRLFWGESEHIGATKTITARDGRKVTMHLPAHIDIMSGNDKAAAFRCWGCAKEVSVFEFDPATLRCTNFGLYNPTTTGIAGTPGNDGHRGVPPSAMCIMAQELRDGVIAHRLKMAVASPADRRLDGKPMPVWPLNGYEKGHGTALPEGAVLRLRNSAYDRVKPTGTAATIARALRDYGAVCGETGGHATIKTMLNATLPTDTGKALDRFTLDDYDVLLLGWGKA